MRFERFERSTNRTTSRLIAQAVNVRWGRVTALVALDNREDFSALSGNSILELSFEESLVARQVRSSGYSTVCRGDVEYVLSSLIIASHTRRQADAHWLIQFLYCKYRKGAQVEDAVKGITVFSLGLLFT